jgi:ribonuclease HI
MSGLFKNEAAAALSLGWTRKEILAVHHILSSVSRLEGPLCKTYSWGMAIHDRVLYRSELSSEKAVFGSLSYDSAECWTDGSGTVSTKPAGIGVYAESCLKSLSPDGEEIRTYKTPHFEARNIGLGTNNVAELKAVWTALRMFPHLTTKLTIHTDSQYAVTMLTTSAIAQVNVELVDAIRQDIALRKSVTVLHCDGHVGVVGNEIADKLANVGRKYVAATEF